MFPPASRLWRRLRQEDRVEALERRVIEAEAALRAKSKEPTASRARKFMGWVTAAVLGIGQLGPLFFSNPQSGRVVVLVVCAGLLGAAVAISLALDEPSFTMFAVAAMFVFSSGGAWLVLELVDTVSVMPDRWVNHAVLARNVAVLVFGPLGVFAVSRLAPGIRRFCYLFLVVLLLNLPSGLQTAIEIHHERDSRQIAEVR